MKQVLMVVLLGVLMLGVMGCGTAESEYVQMVNGGTMVLGVTDPVEHTGITISEASYTVQVQNVLYTYRGGEVLYHRSEPQYTYASLRDDWPGGAEDYCSDFIVVSGTAYTTYDMVVDMGRVHADSPNYDYYDYKAKYFKWMKTRYNITSRPLDPSIAPKVHKAIGLYLILTRGAK